MDHEQLAIERKGAQVEFKFADLANAPGAFEGYGSVFDVVDSHGDMVVKGAFQDSLASHKKAGTMPRMYAEHSPYVGGDLLPVGKWNSIDEDGRGLRVKGKLSALDTDHGRRIRSLMQDGALPALSIAYQVPKDGAVLTHTKVAGEPRRLLNRVNLASIDIVSDPSNGSALIENVKSLLAAGDHAAACAACDAAINLHMSTMSGGDTQNAEERARMLTHLQGIRKALTGQAMPPGVKTIPKTLRECEALLREQWGFSREDARKFAETGFKSLLPRDEGQGKSAPSELASRLTGFTLPTLKKESSK